MVLLSAFPIELPDGEFRQTVYDSLKSRGDAVYIIDGLQDIELTYQEIYEKATSIALTLNNANIGDGSFVASLADPTIESNIFLAAVVISGATFCPLNPALKPDEVRQLLDISGSKYVFCQEKYITTLEEALGDDLEMFTILMSDPHPVYSNIQEMMGEDPSDFVMGTYDPDESIAFVMFTSGTTGVPKGVMCTSFGAKYTAYRMEMPASRFLCISPMYWISYIAITSWALTHGYTLVIPRTKYIEGTNNPDPLHIVDCVQKYRPESWFAGPSTLLELCVLPESSNYDLSSIVKTAVGGSHLLPSQRRTICDTLFEGRNILFNMYGATEVGILTVWPNNEPPDHDSVRSGSVGMLAPGIELKIIDVSTGAELGPHEQGEIVIKSETIMKGYLNKDMPRRYTKDDWYGMGDLGYYDEDGYLYFCSRLKEIMKYRGLQIAPAELEKVILLHPDIIDVCVVGRPHDIDGERPAAFVVKGSDDLKEEDLLDFVHERVIDAKKLRGGVFFIEEIPKSGVGKKLRRNLVDILQTLDE